MPRFPTEPSLDQGTLTKTSPLLEALAPLFEANKAKNDPRTPEEQQYGVIRPMTAIEQGKLGSAWQEVYGLPTSEDSLGAKMAKTLMAGSMFFMGGPKKGPKIEIPAEGLSDPTRLERAAQMGFNTDKTWYHGTQRPDRVVDAGGFSQKRATSGPMAYFTDSPEMASAYSTAKRDTSLGLENQDFANWFKMKPKGSRASVDLDNAWYFLEPQEKKGFLDNINSVALTDKNEIVKGLPNSGISPSTFDYELKRNYGNGFKAAKELWLNSGAIYNSERDFLKVLEHAGIDPKRFTFHDPHASNSGVFPVYLKMQNPLNTADRQNLLKTVIPELEQASKRQTPPKFNHGVDMWDKDTRDPMEWIQQLKEDTVAGNNSIAWTSVPDWVTNRLKGMGYDGILDAGGKYSQADHAVAVPFAGNQVRSKYAKFDPAKANSRNLMASLLAALGIEEATDHDEK